jgi:hypothetical protein
MTPARAARARSISIAAVNRKLYPDKSGLVIASEVNADCKSVFKNVVRGFSLVLHDPEGSHYKIENVVAQFIGLACKGRRVRCQFMNIKQ